MHLPRAPLQTCSLKGPLISGCDCLQKPLPPTPSAIRHPSPVPIPEIVQLDQAIQNQEIVGKSPKGIIIIIKKKKNQGNNNTRIQLQCAAAPKRTATRSRSQRQSQKSNHLAQKCPSHSIVPGSRFSSSAEKIHHPLRCARTPSVMTSRAVSGFLLLLVRVCKSPVVLL